MKPAWKDAADDIPDEEGLKHRSAGKIKAKKGAKYESRLQDQFQLVHGPTPSWAQLDSTKTRKRKKKHEDDDDEDEKIYLNIKSKSLLRGELNIYRVLDLNNESREAGAILRSVKFHPTSQVGLVAGNSGVVTLYQVDGIKNAKIQSVEFENFPLRNACFSTDGDEILVSSGLKSHFYSYDMLSGEITKIRPNRLTQKETIRKLIPSPDKRIIVGVGHNGNMYLFSTLSKEIIHTLTMNGEVTDICFNADGSRMYSCGEFGEVYTWDMKTRSCIGKFIDEGAISGSTIATSADFLACGSNSGVVNIYKNENSIVEGPNQVLRSPEKSIMNLVTQVTSLEFNNPAGEILAMSSKEKDTAIKLVHIPSMTVFSNFPFINTNWGRPNAIAFSPNSGYFCVGNNRGSAYLYRLKHYENY